MEIKNAITPFEILNSTEWPNVYSCRFLEDGIVSYKDLPNGGIAYLTNETIAKMVSTFVGKPVCIDHQKITPENYEEFRQSGVIVGNVIRIWKNAEDGWWWCDFLVDTEAGRQRIKAYKDKVSCAYKVLDTKEGGLWHDIPYDAEIMDGYFTHLALVENPRYEGSIITEQIPEVLCNDKSAYILTYREGTDMSKIVEFLKDLGNGKKEKVNFTVAINGTEAPLADVLETLILNSKPAAAAAAEPLTLEIGGKKYTQEEIMNGFKKFVEASNAKCNCNAKEGDMHKDDCPMYDNKKNSKEGEEKEAEMKKNSVENAKKKQELEEFFNKLTDMANKVESPEDMENNGPAPKTRAERAAAFSAQVKVNMGRK